MIGTTSITRRRWTLSADAAYGDMKRTGSPADVTITGCAVSPRSSSDITAPARQGTLIGLTVHAPATADIERTDQIVYLGDVYEIDGDVGRWVSPYSKIDGLEFALRRAEG